MLLSEKCHLIWSNDDLDYERDWKADLEEDYPELTDDEREQLMYELNNDYLDDERANLNVSLGRPIIVIGDLGLWYGRRIGYKDIPSGNIRDCLYAGRDDDYVTWYVDELGDLRCRACHHDGTNYYTYRVFKYGTTYDQMENLKYKLYQGTATRKDITRYTERLGDAIANVYGFKIRKKPTRKAVS